MHPKTYTYAMASVMFLLMIPWVVIRLILPNPRTFINKYSDCLTDDYEDKSYNFILSLMHILSSLFFYGIIRIQMHLFYLPLLKAVITRPEVWLVSAVVIRRYIALVTETYYEADETKRLIEIRDNKTCV